MRNGAYYMNSLNTQDKYPFKTYKFEFPESDDDAVMDIFIRHTGNSGKLNFFITANRTGDLECSLLNATGFGPGEHHFRLTRDCLENFTTAETFFVSVTSENNEGFYNIPFETRIHYQEKVKYEKIDKEIAVREFLSNPYRSSFFEVDLRKDKNNTITSFSLSHPHDEITSTSRLIVSDEMYPSDLCLNSTYSCTSSGSQACTVELESCKRKERQFIYLSATPIYSNLTQVPLTLGYSAKEYPIVTLSENEEYYRENPTEWSFFELDTEHDFYSSKIINVQIKPENTESMTVHLTRGGITKGGNCADEFFICEGNSLCNGSFALCDFDYNGTSIYLSIRSLPAFSSKYKVKILEKEENKISLNSTIESSISTYETHMFVIDEGEKEEKINGMATIEFIESLTNNDLILAVVASNESNCPVQSSCTVNSVNTICSIPLICLGEAQQPYLKVTTDKKELGSISYSISFSSLKEQSLNKGQKNINFNVNDEKWVYIEEEYDVNIRYKVTVTEGNAQLNMYRDCVELDDIICEKDQECFLFANRNDKAYGGTYWLRIRPDDGVTSTSGSLSLSVGAGNCQNITAEFCGPMFADIVGIDNITEYDQLAKASYDALELTLGSEICSSIKEYVCGIYFPVCGEFGVAPAICKENCFEAFDECKVSSTCPYKYCESLPECPIPPESSGFYSGYIALIVIYSLLAIGIAFTVIVIIIKGE